MRLDELGERRIIDEILRPRYGMPASTYFGDDCARVVEASSIGGGTVVATTDPCPEPMAAVLGFSDPYYRGWLLATINLSDLAAAGARPLGLLTSLILPNETTTDELGRLLDGIDECCASNETRVIGGNLKEGSKIDLSATAIGFCITGNCLSRTGCLDGDAIVVIGDFGLFWAGVLAVQHKLLTGSNEHDLLRNILTPMPKVRVGWQIALNQLLTACLDNSDGLYASLAQLAASNQRQMYVNMSDVIFPSNILDISSAVGVDPVRLSLGWGDWQLVGCCKLAEVDRLKKLGQECGVPVYVIGEVRPGTGVVLDHNDRIAEMAAIDSQRFTPSSWFTTGLDSYQYSLLQGPLWKE